MQLNMKSFPAGAYVNPAFKRAQPLPVLPGQPTSSDGNWLQLGCAGCLKFRAAAKPRPNSGPGLVGAAILRAVAQPGNAPGLSQAWAGRSL
jgi:hypothetical protein